MTTPHSKLQGEAPPSAFAPRTDDEAKAGHQLPYGSQKIADLLTRGKPCPVCGKSHEAASPPSTATPTHELTVWPEYFAALLSGVKTFEFRKDDREPRFAVGDVLRLHEWVPPYRAETEDEWSKLFGGDYTGREVLRRVTYVARGGVIPKDFCVMAIEPIQPPTPTDNA